MDLVSHLCDFGDYVELYYCICLIVMSLEQKCYEMLEKARVELHQSNDRNVKFDCLQTIISKCRFLKIDPLPYLKPRADLAEKTIQGDVLKCEFCDFQTNLGIQSLRAHVGMKHKKTKQ